MNRHITWIREIWNKTDEPFTVYCWDSYHEGIYHDIATNIEIGINNGGSPVTLAPGMHVRTTVGSCGIPDGGEKKGMPKRRVFFLGHPGSFFDPSIGPRCGLRMNRTPLNNLQDQILFTDEATGEHLGRLRFLKGTEQTVDIKINPKEKGGVLFNVIECSKQTELKWEKTRSGTAEWVVSNGIDLAMKAYEVATALSPTSFGA